MYFIRNQFQLFQFFWKIFHFSGKFFAIIIFRKTDYPRPSLGRLSLPLSLIQVPGIHLSIQNPDGAMLPCRSRSLIYYIKECTISWRKQERGQGMAWQGISTIFTEDFGSVLLYIYATIELCMYYFCGLAGNFA